MHRAAAACALLVAALAVAGCLSDSERADRARQQAREALARGDLPAVHEALEELRASRPDTPEALIELTRLMSYAGEAPQAIWLLEEGLTRFPDRDDLRVELGRVALVVQNPVLARSAVEPVPPESPSHLRALLLRAQANFELGNLDAGLAVLEEAQRLYPDSPEARTARIATLMREGRLEDARAAIEEMREAVADPDEARALELLAARVQSALGDPDGAADRVRALVDAEPTDAVALQSLVQLLVQAGRAEEALELAERAVETDAEQAPLWAVLAQVQLHLGRFEEAERSIRSSVDHAPSPTAYTLLAQFYEQREEPERVAEVFAEAAEKFPETPMLRMHLAESLLELSRVEEARQELARFRTASPHDPHAEYLLARIELEEGDAAAAVKRLRSTVSVLDRAYTQYWLGRALEATGDDPGAERRYGLALVRGGANPAPAIALLGVAERRGDWPAVAQRALQLIQRAPGLAAGFETGVTALVRSGQSEAAIQLARRFRERFPEKPSAVALQALALRSGGQLDEAERVLDEAAQAGMADPELAVERSMLLGTRGRFDEAIEVGRGAVAERPEEARYRAALAALLFGAGRSEEGAQEVDRALALAPDDPSPLKLRAQYFASKGDYARARLDCLHYLELRPRDASVQFMLGLVLAELGNTGEAIAAYRKAIELDERAFAAHNNLALILAEHDDLDGGLAIAQKAYAIAESNPNVVDTLGWLYLKKGLAERAVALLEKARELDPALPGPQLHLALAYRDVGRRDDARELLVALVDRVGEESELGSEARDALRSLGE